MREIELLAPARDLTTGIEAICHGADAVYIGAHRFGARAAAGNSIEDIRQLVEYAHPYGVKIYVTLNTILFDSELDDVHQLVCELSDIGVDALIVQDFAVYEMAKDVIGSNLNLHASTQMDNRTAEKVAWLRDIGFRQVVLARELTLGEISEIHRQVPDVRLEVFVHGAICVSYNGQCYASQHCFGRSANRGECAQFCRMPFDLIDAEGHVLQRQKHLLSLRDMNRSHDLEALLDAGVSSLKIEGRLKDVTYVKNVVAYYRQQLDEIFRRRNEYHRSSLGHESITFRPDPTKSFNRLFTDYFLHGRTPNMANILTPKSMGEPVTSQTQFSNGDGICYINREGMLEGMRINNTEKGLPPILAKGVKLYRNHDQQFQQLLSKPTATRKIYVHWLLKDTDDGFILRLTREDGQSTEKQFPYPHEVARSPQTEPIKRQLSRLGDTPYECTGIDIELSYNWFIPGSVLAEWRRCLCGEMSESPLTLNHSPLTLNHSPLTLHHSYQSNVANHLARKFYLDNGANQVEWALEVEKPKDNRPLLIMTCRYCIRHELGLCPKRQKDEGKKTNGTDHTPSTLFLRLSDGRRFPLRFDCKQCIMEVYAES